MQPLYLHGSESLAFYDQPGILEQCGVPEPEDLSNSTIGDYIAAGPADFCLVEMPDNHIPAVSKSDLAEIREKYGFSPPIHVLVSTPLDRRRNHKIHSHVLPEEVPSKQFLSLEDNLYLASPELTLLQVAPRFSDIELIAICSKFFAIFEKDPEAVGGVALRQPLSSPELCLLFLEKSQGANGVAKLRSAVGFAAVHAASPTEILVDLIYTLPWHLGGYNLGPFSFNHKVNTEPFYNDGTTHERYCDCFFPEGNVSIEYDGREPHERKAATATDRIRQTELAGIGIKEFVITKELLTDTNYLDSIAKSVAKLCGGDLPTITPAFRQKQRRLIEQIRRRL